MPIPGGPYQTPPIVPLPEAEPHPAAQAAPTQAPMAALLRFLQGGKSPLTEELLAGVKARKRAQFPNAYGASTQTASPSLATHSVSSPSPTGFGTSALLRFLQGGF